VQARRRAPEVQLLGNRDEISELAKFHGCPMAAASRPTDTETRSINPNQILDRITPAA
jgi:hypothetical protein